MDGSSVAHYLLNPKAAQAAGISPFLSSPLPFQQATGGARALSEPRQPGVLDDRRPYIYSQDAEFNAYSRFSHQGRMQANKAGGASVVATPSIPQYDPRVLLNPRGANKRPYPDAGADAGSVSSMETPPPSSVQPPGSDPGTTRTNGETFGGAGMGSMIERMHNVSSREARPPKKQKRNSNEPDGTQRTKAVFAGGGKGGVIGEYMKQKREEGRHEPAASGPVVDLTEGDDDDLVLLRDNGDIEVCYGRIQQAWVQAHQVPHAHPDAKSVSPSMWPVIGLHLTRPNPANHIISVHDPCGHHIGNVDTHTALGLSKFLDVRTMRLRVSARILARHKKPGEFPGQPTSSHYDMVINLYGPRKFAEQIGRFLSQKQIWLRTPLFLERGVVVVNPHDGKAPSLFKSAISGSASAGSSGYVSRTVEEIRNDVIGMFDSLQKSENLPEMEPDARVITPLLSHQKQALYFMSEREQIRSVGDMEEGGRSLWRLHHGKNGETLYYNVITGKEEPSKPPEVLGGILADMMGLGKTLSILALIVSTSESAEEFAKQKPPPPHSPEDVPLCRNAKTTLLVSPLSTISNWEEQIKTHIQPGGLKYYVFHGSNRCNDPAELSKYDIIITTYSVVSSEYDRRSKKRGANASPLEQTNWFRIVLDEAHMIREQSTRQSKAICSLSAQRRWAVTGTPVQNRLDDLGALIKFLRIKPFDEKGGFTQYILSPFKNADPEILPKLRLLVDSITLRRLKDRINLPPRHDKLVKLEFSEDEKILYDWFAKDSDRKMRVVASEKQKGLGGKVYVHILQAILRLRLICAHGRELLSEEDLKMTEGFSKTNAIDLDDDDDGDHPSLTSKQAYDMLSLMKETDADVCASCDRKIGPKEGDIIAEDSSKGKNEVIGYMTPCYQILCKDCIGPYKEAIASKANAEKHAVCPLCEQYIRISFFELKQGSIEEDEEARVRAKGDPTRVKKMGRYGGPHTKTRALLEALWESKQESEGDPNQAPIKSVVFSGWTSHLDLIEIALENANISYTRLDGKMTRIQRTAALNAFRDDPSVRVMLVSIAAGGLGLNLTTASKVYVMEPQFNPAAEAQAIDRVHRLGPTREVTTVRFIMRGSFEEKMLELQRKKQNLADLSMNRGKLDKAEATKRRLEELRSLFK